MSWSVNRIGTKEAVTAKVAEDFDKCAANYAGKEEEKDVLACKARALVAIADLATDVNGVKVEASGSHGSWGTSCKVDVTRVQIDL